MLISQLKRLAASVADRMLANSEFSALQEVRKLRQVFKLLQIDCVLDVGANSGQYGTMLRSRVGFEGHIISFEPNPTAFAELSKCTQSDHKWYAHNLALSDEKGPLKFNIMVDSQFSSLHTPTDDEFNQLTAHNTIASTVDVNGERLDHIYPALKSKHHFKSSFLKMDTQGNDLRVFHGSSAAHGDIRGLQSELSFKKLYEDSHYYHQAIQEYQRYGFELSALVPNNSGHFPWLVEMDCIMINRMFIK